MRKASRDRPGTPRHPRGRLSGTVAPPRKEPGKARSRLVAIRLKQEELEAIQRRADQHGESVSEYIRKAVKAELSRPGRPVRKPFTR